MYCIRFPSDHYLLPAVISSGLLDHVKYYNLTRAERANWQDDSPELDFGKFIRWPWVTVASVSGPLLEQLVLGDPRWHRLGMAMQETYHIDGACWIRIIEVGNKH